MRTEAQIMELFMRLACRLSPENLHADGERSMSMVRRIRVEIQHAWGELEKELGRTVTEADVWNYRR